MLKLVHLEDVNRLATNRDHTLGHLAAIERGELEVMVNGQKVADPEALKEIKQVLVRNCNARIGRINRQLLEHGIDVQA